MTWQPIETAPKDREVLVYDDGAILISLWVEDDGTGGWWDHGFMEPPPTHWMPLPDPPTSGEVTTSTPSPTTEPRLQELITKMRVVIEAVRAVGTAGHWDAPHWTLHVPAREANALFDLAYELDPELVGATSAPEEPR